MRSREALLALAVVVCVAFSAAVAHARPVVHDNGQSRAEILRYWTPKRMQNAKPAERLVGKPAKGKPGGGTTAGTAVEVPTPYPSAQGKVFFSDGTWNYVCSGTALVSSNQSVVWTAGHCVNEGPGDFYTNFMFVPAYRDGSGPYGSFAASALLTTSGWRNSGEFGVDEGAAVVGENASGQTLSQAVAERSLVVSSARNQSYSLYGYPAAKRFSGERLYVCNTAWSLDDSSASPATMGVPCNMTGGSSGGGWVTSSGAVASVVSYGYASLKNVLFGPYQSTEAAQLYSAAQTQTP